MSYDASFDFPYKKITMNDDEIRLKISEIKNNIPKSSSQPYRLAAIQQKLNLIDGTYQGKYIKIITTNDLYDKVNVLTDYFNERSRMKCSFNNYLEPINYFRIYNKKILRDVPNKDPHEIREYIYSHIKECNLFKVSTATFVYNFFKATNILDFSSGWGDRLLAACALGAKYFGVDPNIDNHEGYNNIIKYAGNSAHQRVYRSGAEYLPKSVVDAWIKQNGKFDLIFTSPPYFDYEIYSSSLQSVSSYAASTEHWLTYFLFVVLIKYIPYLEVGGTLGIYIQDIRNKLIVCEPIVLFMLSFYADIEFSGIITENLPMLLFKKTNKNTVTNKEIEKKFMITYPKVYELVHRLIKRKLYLNYTIDTTLQRYDNYLVVDDNVENNIYFRTYFKYFIQDDAHTNIVTYGSKKSILPYYLSKVAHMLKKKSTFYCPHVEDDHTRYDNNMNFVASQFSSAILDAKKQFDLNIIEIDIETTKKQLSVLEQSIPHTTDDYVVTFTNYDPSIQNIMRETIYETVTILDMDVEFVGTIFVAVSSTLEIVCLYDIFRFAKFFIVQSGSHDFTKSYEMGRTTLIYAEYAFVEDAPRNGGNIRSYFDKYKVPDDILWLSAI